MKIKKEGRNYIFSVKVDGRWTRRSTGTDNYKEALRIASKMRADSAVDDAGLPRAPAKIKFETYKAKYLKHSRARLRQTTVERMRKMLNGPLSYFDNYFLHEIKLRHVEAYQLKRRDDGVRGRTINHEVVVLSGLFTRAIGEKLLREKPWNKTPKLPTLDSEKRTALTRDEVFRLLEQARAGRDYESYAWTSTLIYTGCRPGEIARLKWSDIDFTKDTVKVIGGKTGDRTVPLLPQLKEILRAMPQKGEKIFQHSHRDAFRIACERAGINAVPYTLRHTFATMLIESGADVKTLSSIMGNSPAVLLSTYAHSFEERRKSAIMAAFPNYSQVSDTVIPMSRGKETG